MAVTIPPIDPPLDPPSRGSPGPVFRAAADAFMARWPVQINQIRASITAINSAGTLIEQQAAQTEQARAAALQHRNDAQAAAATALNAPGTIASSTTELDIAAIIAAGTATLTIQPGKAIAVGLPYSVAAPGGGNRFKGIAQSYNSGTGVLELREVTGVGTGTFSSWSVGLTSDGSLPAATPADYWAGTSNAKAITPATAAALKGFSDLTDASTITWDVLTKGYRAKVTLGGNRIIGVPSGLVLGDQLTLLVINPASGGPWTPVPAANWEFGVTPSWNTAAGKINRIRGEVIQVTPSILIDANFKRAA